MGALKFDVEVEEEDEEANEELKKVWQRKLVPRCFCQMS
jgi:hypothetical protein